MNVSQVPRRTPQFRQLPIGLVGHYSCPLQYLFKRSHRSVVGQWSFDHLYFLHD